MESSQFNNSGNPNMEDSKEDSKIDNPLPQEIDSGCSSKGENVEKSSSNPCILKDLEDDGEMINPLPLEIVNSKDARRARDAERKRLKRLQETPEESQERRVKNAERARIRFSQETEQERTERLEAARQRHRVGTQEELEKRRESNLKRVRLCRENETAEEGEARRATEAERRRQSLLNETPDEADARRAKNSERDRIRLENESTEERGVRNALHAIADLRRLLNESESETNQRRTRQAERNRQRLLGETEDEAVDRKARNAASKRRSIENETEEERADRIDAVAQRRKEKESAEDVEAKKARLAKQKDKDHQVVQKKNQRSRAKFQLRNIEDLEEHYLGPMNKECAHCGALFFEEEWKSRTDKCCGDGKVKMEKHFENFPQLLEDYFNGTSPDSANFRANVRQFNSSVALASMGASIDLPPGHGPYTFKIHGQVYHHAGPLHPPSGKRPSYGQIYVLDTAQAAEERMSVPANSNCDKTIMEELSNLMAQINPYARSYKMMAEVEEQEKQSAKLTGSAVKNVSMVFDLGSKEKLDLRRYNAPTTSEVALIYVAEDGDVPLNRSIAAYGKDGQLTILTETDDCVDPMVYPLFFPTGHPGWNINTKMNSEDVSSKKITLLAYYKYLFQERAEIFNPLHYGGSLFQQFAVDSWVKVEQKNLNFLRFQQPRLRAEEYRELKDFVDQNEQGPNPGRRVILPSSFKGSPRQMMQEYQDAMCMVTEHGKPDYFLTFTCNPKWREITENLKNGQQPTDRPDLIARVFKLKVNELMKTLREYKIFGEVKSWLYVFEWQKRGLPHIHLLLTMCEGFKPKTADDVDKWICAEIPDQKTFPRLHQVVTSNMVHRPCGLANPNAPCMKATKDKGVKMCSKRFPKPYCSQTKIDLNGYPDYRRRDDGQFVEYSRVKLTNQNVVPYSPLLLLRFNAHINLEVCALIESVKYLFKYVYKGPDKAAIQMRQLKDKEDGKAPDEINQYLDCRYICAPEACHHLFGFRTSLKSDVIYRLAVHLPDCQTVYFAQGNETSALDSSRDKRTILTAFFHLNAQFAKLEEDKVDLNGKKDPRQFVYNEMPQHFTFDKKKNIWQVRKTHEKAIGRMYSVPPSDPERFALRLLLLNRKGPTSFEDLRTTKDENGAPEVHETFVLAARALGLLRDDAEYIKALEECSKFKMPAEMRSFFAEILGFNEIGDPQALWDGFKDAMSEDYIFRGCSSDEAEALAYQNIKEKLEKLSKKFESFVAPPLFDFQGVPDFVDYEEAATRAEQLYDTLNPEQKATFDAIMRSVDDPSLPRIFYIDGPGGSGKTYLYNALCTALTGRRMKFACTAWTGIASTLLPDGRTSASLFKLDINRDCESSTLKMNTQHATQLKELDLIIWDEASMIPKKALHTADQVLRDVASEENKNKLFGGKIFVAGGDFRQVLPVVRRGTRTDQVDACIKRSPLWSHFTVHKLISNMRVTSNDTEWKEFILTVGDGTANNEDGEVELDESLICRDDLITETFGNQIDTSTDLSDTAIIAPKNIDVEKMNDDVLSRMIGEEKVYYSRDEVCDDNRAKFLTTELLNSIQTSSLPPHALKLKVGCSVMLLRNLDVSAGLCNGTRLIVQEMGRRVLRCKFAVGSRQGDQVLIPRIYCADDKNLAFQLRRTQFPVRLAFAMTLNKSQGQSFKKIGLWLPDDVFSHGQLYVALSRVRSKEGLKIMSNNPNSLNVVYPEVL